MKLNISSITITQSRQRVETYERNHALTNDVFRINFAALFALIITLKLSRWLLWLALSLLISLLQFLFCFYQGFRIALDLIVLSNLSAYVEIRKWLKSTLIKSRNKNFRNNLKRAESYNEWISWAQTIDDFERLAIWKENDADFPSYRKLIETTFHLKYLRDNQDYISLMHELPSIIKRNHLGIDDVDNHNNCLSGTKKVIEDFIEELCACIDFVCDNNRNSYERKVSFLQKLSKNLGHSALCLSGGGAISMYHLGVLKSFIANDIYRNIHVISGTSGGSITCAMCACMTEAELLQHAICSDVSTNFRRDGSMKRENIRWFPPLWQQALNFLKTGFLMNNIDFVRTCNFFWKDITFAEVSE